MPHTRTASEIFDSLVSKGGEVLPPRHLSVRIFAFDGMQAQEKSRTQFTSGRAGLASDWPRKQYVCSSVGIAVFMQKEQRISNVLARIEAL